MKAERHIEGYAVSPIVSLLMRGRERVVDGWCKKELVKDDGSVCAVGAISNRGPNSEWEWSESMWCLSRSLPNPRETSICMYNDHPTTTKADILSLYDRAIEMAIGESR